MRGYVFLFWEALEKSSGVFKKGTSDAEKQLEEKNNHIAQLERKVGQLTYEVNCLKRALSWHKPEIINSDQGGHFTNPDYLKLLDEAEVRVSMDGTGQALDNIRTERFFRTLKYDLIYINEFERPIDLRKARNQYIPQYNTYRPHTSLDGLCPFQVYSGNAIAVAFASPKTKMIVHAGMMTLIV